MENIFEENMRKLTSEEIENLSKQGCLAEDWTLIYVEESFLTDAIEEVTFKGKNYLSRLIKRKHEGLYRATIHNCIIERGVYIADIAEQVACYHIAEGSTIYNVRKMVYEPFTRCGEGASVSPLDEMGSRAIILMDILTAPLAYLLLFARHSETLIRELNDLSHQYVCKEMPAEHSYIAPHSEIKGCGDLINLHIKKSSVITDVPRLKNVTLVEARLSTGVVAEDTVCVKDAVIEEYSTLARCFVGECTHIHGAFSASDCLFFSNCQFAGGEAVSSVLGPHSVSHHRSTLLVGSLVSFFNAGSGTNQSNHHYQLGPIHYGVMERGCKTASNAYLLWPAHIGAYTFISGRITNRSSYLDFPFSTLSQEGRFASLEPGVQLASIGLYRDVYKWEKRDRRLPGKRPLDPVDYRMFSPSLIFRMLNGYRHLVATKAKRPEAENYVVQSAHVTRTALERGIRYYRSALLLSLIEMLPSLKDLCEEDVYPTRYYDFLGTTMADSALQELYNKLNAKSIHSIEEIHLFIHENGNPKATYQSNEILATLSPKPLSHEEKLFSLLDEMELEIPKLLKEALATAEREARPKRTVSFGLLATEKKEIEKEIQLLREPILQQPFIDEFRDRIERLPLQLQEIRNSLRLHLS